MLTPPPRESTADRKSMTPVYSDELAGVPLRVSGASRVVVDSGAELCILYTEYTYRLPTNSQERAPYHVSD